MPAPSSRRPCTACSTATRAPPAASPGCVCIGLDLWHSVPSGLKLLHISQRGEMCVAAESFGSETCLFRTHPQPSPVSALPPLFFFLPSSQVITSFSKQQGRVTSPWVEVGGVQWRLKVRMGSFQEEGGQEMRLAGGRLPAIKQKCHRSLCTLPAHICRVYSHSLPSRCGLRVTMRRAAATCRVSSAVGRLGCWSGSAAARLLQEGGMTPNLLSSTAGAPCLDVV